ncbi:MAG: hypothetical protein PHP54_03745 [Clostridia bacterium]|nr:hypothetical protein [Clostridia bacterium]
MEGFINFDAFNFNSYINIIHNKFITEELFLLPLYKKISDIPISISESLPIGEIRLELYCYECRKKRIYTFAIMGTEDFFRENGQLRSNEAPKADLSMMNSNDFFYFIAKADCGHKLIILFKIIDRKTIMKVGQFPSIYDMNETINNKPFMKELGEEYSKYYKTACSLNSFDSNIGAMTYLRRIFEKILLECFNENKCEITMEEKEFFKLRMEEKLAILKKFLPKIIFNDGYNTVYSKVSNGIHNLSEGECEKLFIPLKMAIEEILIEKIELKNKEARQIDLGKKLRNI